MREEVNTEQGTASKKSEIPSFLSSKKKESCQIFCAAVAQRYLLVHARITFASGKISPPKGRHGFTSKIQNGKSNHIRPDMEARFRRAHQGEAVPQRPPESTDRKKRHEPQVRQWGRRLGTEMFDSYEEFIPLSLLHDDEEDTHQKSGFSGLSW